MSHDKVPISSTADFETIEAAVMETARGRWFLAEYARRTRAAETDKLLAAIARLGASRAGDGEAAGKLRAELAELFRILARTRAELAGLRTTRPGADALDTVLHSLDRASAKILDSAGEMHETAWRLREEGANPSLCDRLEQRASDIYAACSSLGAGFRGTTRLIETLRVLEERVAVAIGRTPPDVDCVASQPPAREPAAAMSWSDSKKPGPDPVHRSIPERPAAVERIDSLETREKLRRFT